MWNRLVCPVQHPIAPCPDKQLFHLPQFLRDNHIVFYFGCQTTYLVDHCRQRPGINPIRAAALSEQSPWEFKRLYRNAYSTPDDADNAIVTACCTISHDVKRIKNGETDRHRFSRIGLITNQRVQHQSYVLYVLFIFLVVLYGDVCLPKPLRVMGNCLLLDSVQY